MKLSIPIASWNEEFIEIISNYAEVDELYGKFAYDLIGGGKAVALLYPDSKKQVERCIRKIHGCGLKINYLLNSICIDNIEFTRRGQKEICSILDWLSMMKVDRVTVSIPFLLEFIKKRYPHFKVVVGQFASVSTLESVRSWISSGADQIILHDSFVTRDFPFLRSLSKYKDCVFSLIVNEGCMYSCFLFYSHNCATSHSSQTRHKLKGLYLDYYRCLCSYKRILEPHEVIKAVWIRPEDLHFYEEAGISHFKIVDRTFPNELIIDFVRAYSARNYDGNLLDLLSYSRNMPPGSLMKKASMIKYLFRPFLINISLLFKLKKVVGPWKMEINNKELDGFLDFFIKNGDCRTKDCQECGYCKRVAEKVIKVDPQWQKEIAALYKEILEQIITG